MNIQTKTFDDIWPLAVNARIEFIKNTFREPKYAFVGRKQYIELRKAATERLNLVLPPGKMELMGMELIKVDRDDFFKVTE